MSGLNSFMSLSVPAGRIAGISIRIHLLFILYVLFQLLELKEGLLFSMGILAGTYVCILLHEFGHALAARWCGGVADEILIWPLGGLAYCEPPHHPTPHLITTVGGPLVTLVLWGLLSGIAALLLPDPDHGISRSGIVTWFYFHKLAGINLTLLLFNLIPTFPMDGGRILRNTLWHFIPLQKANRVTFVVAVLACIVLVTTGVRTGDSMMIFVGIYAFFCAAQEISNPGYVELWQMEPWSFQSRTALARSWRPERGKESRRNPGQPAKAVRYEPKIVPRPDISSERVAVAKIDAILEKISRSGFDSLEDWEKKELEKASKELKRQDG